MKKCDCYRDDLYSDRAICFGTKEMETCSCGGDEAKCDFYTEVREKAYSENTASIKDRLIELIEAIPYHRRLYPDLFVDYLIENGVTVKEKINGTDNK